MTGHHDCIDLAVRTLGGSVIAASDESFGVKERLIDGEPAFVPGVYDLRGEVVDGWETKRHAGPDGDWAIVRLGVPGRVRAVDVDTRFFTGNHPIGYRLDGAVLDPAADACAADVDWWPLVDTTSLKSDSHNVIGVRDPRRGTHVR
ncbi:MAG: allantoicase, partial [Pseudonocardiales bacterium]|nr:allantoicase [Pseudonocardiales bacterium]